MFTAPVPVPRGVRLGLVLATPALLVAACGGSSGSKSSQTSPASSKSASAPMSSVETHSGDLGTYLTDGSGRTLYLFAADHGTTSTCSGACASAWPPFVAKGSPTAAGGAKKSMLGATSRPGGSKQVTYAGHPLYYFAGDSAAGDAKGEGVNGFGAKWWLVSPSGTAIMRGSGGGAMPSGGSSSSGGSGGSGGGGGSWG